MDVISYSKLQLLLHIHQLTFHNKCYIFLHISYRQQLQYYRILWAWNKETLLV